MLGLGGLPGSLGRLNTGEEALGGAAPWLQSTPAQLRHLGLSAPRGHVFQAMGLVPKLMPSAYGLHGCPSIYRFSPWRV
ncbi:hypothetical protein NDU88_003805 [Pleurodeles waltl]|uniref:Uncharacterized protein n=1 Tax=Pleurodeles waltl TaxID=8319 RepID=A0AAV7UEP5_PLEWA|nr:hypothetical protein NDU88_003805 [Pleurodeles waltl]